jgi:hypothetical protein
MTTRSITCKIPRTASQGFREWWSSMLKQAVEILLWMELFFRKKIIIMNDVRGDSQNVEKSLKIYNLLSISRKIVLYYMKTKEIAIRMNERSDCITRIQESFVRRIKELFDKEEE